jgi:hypothetical protein
VLGFAPKREFDADGYLAFLHEIGLPPDSFEVIDGAIPLAVPVSIAAARSAAPTIPPSAS